MKDIIMWNKKYKECLNCHTTTKSYYSKGLCYRCYHIIRWATNKDVRDKQRALTYRWRLRNPERWRIMSLKASAKWQLKKRMNEDNNSREAKVTTKSKVS